MLRRLALALAFSTALTAAGIQPAQAGPAALAIAAIAANPIGAFALNLAFSFAVSEAKTLIQGFFGTSQKDSSASNGVRLTMGASGIDPQAFIMGYRATAGTLNYWGSWGEVDGTPNALLTLEFILSDVPMRHLTGAIIGDKRIAIPDMSGARPTAQGWPVPEFNDGKDNLWIAYRNGSQTAPDAFLRATFGGDADRPYSADMVGRGRACVTATLRVNATLFPSGRPNMLWETDGIDLYDISKDSTRGGSGAHRADNPATWEPSPYLPVHIFNVLKGIYWGDEWVYGLQNADLDDLPPSAWIAAINEAKLAIPLAAGGTEPQFAGGLEVTVDTQPADTIEASLQGCAGKLAEIGGTYKPLIGAAPAPVYSFTDANVIITRDRTIDPFPRLDDTFNGSQGSCPSPEEGWTMKAAPAVFMPNLEAEDGGRRMAPSIQFQSVSSGTQVQRLVTAGVKDGRNFRRPSVVLPPEASDLEPLDVVAWTSASEGYSTKAFLIDSADDEPTYLFAARLLETDPSAFDWDESTDEQPTSVGFLSGRRPPAQVLVSPSLVGAIVADDDGVPRRAGVTFGWDGNVDDVRAVGFQLRRASDAGVILTDSTDDVKAGRITLTSPAILPGAALQGREIYYPATGNRVARWSNQDVDGNDGDWLDVLVPNVLIGGDDIAAETIEAANMVKELQNLLGPVLSDVQSKLLDHDQLIGAISQVVMDLEADHQQQITGLGVKSKAAAAGIIETSNVLISALGTLAAHELRLAAVQNDLAAEVVRSESAETGLNGAIATLSDTVAANFLSLSASVSTVSIAQAGTASSLATLTTTESAHYGSLSAGGIMQWVASAGTNGAVSRVSLGITATDGVTVVTAGIYYEITGTVGHFASRVVSLADKHYWSDGSTGLNIPMSYIGGVLTVDQLAVRLVTSPDGTSVVFDTTVPKLLFTV